VDKNNRSSNKKSSDVDGTEKVLSTIKLSNIIIPMILGISVVGYLMWRQLDMDDLRSIPLSRLTIIWIGLAVFMYVLRHLFYAWRLRIMTHDFFGWKKSIELIFIWEFSSAISPSSIGGSGVALFLLAQEKIGAARTVSVILYSMILDTIFFLITIPLLVFTLGPKVIRPGLEGLSLDGYAYTLLIIYVFILSYGAVFFYGLFFSPQKIRAFLHWLSKFKLIKRFRRDLVQIGSDVVETSREINKETMGFHAKAFLSTCGAWITRFLAINCIIIAILPDTPLDTYTQYLLYGRGEIMHSITQFSPTPGGAGVMEYLFGGFFTDYIPKGISFLIALIWRIITYYPYLIAGVIIIPIWVTKIINRKRQERVKSEE